MRESSNRMKAFSIGEREVFDWFVKASQSWRACSEVLLPKYDLPADATISRVFHVPQARSFCFIVESESFPEVPQGHIIPEDYSLVYDAVAIATVTPDVNRLRTEVSILESQLEQATADAARWKADLQAELDRKYPPRIYTFTQTKPVDEAALKAAMEMMDRTNIVVPKFFTAAEFNSEVADRRNIVRDHAEREARKRIALATCELLAHFAAAGVLAIRLTKEEVASVEVRARSDGLTVHDFAKKHFKDMSGWTADETQPGVNLNVFGEWRPNVHVFDPSRSEDASELRRIHDEWKAATSKANRASYPTSGTKYIPADDWGTPKVKDLGLKLFENMKSDPAIKAAKEECQSVNEASLREAFHIPDNIKVEVVSVEPKDDEGDRLVSFFKGTP